MSTRDTENERRWFAHKKENLARVRSILQMLDISQRAGDTNWDSAYYRLRDWKQYTTSPANLSLALKDLENLNEKDLVDKKATVPNSRLRRVILAEIERCEQAVATAKEDLKRSDQASNELSEENRFNSQIEQTERCDIFFSYSHEDEELANELVDMFRKCNLDVFHASSSIEPGAIWLDSIRSKLLGACVAVLLLTTKSQSAD